MDREMPVAAPALDARIPLAFGSVVGLTLLAALVATVQRERSRRAPTAEQLAARREELIAQVARLDDLHALGELDERAWQRKRARLKEEALDIAQAGQETGSLQ